MGNKIVKIKKVSHVKYLRDNEAVLYECKGHSKERVWMIIYDNSYAITGKETLEDLEKESENNKSIQLFRGDVDYILSIWENKLHAAMELDGEKDKEKKYVSVDDDISTHTRHLKYDLDNSIYNRFLLPLIAFFFA